MSKENTFNSKHFLPTTKQEMDALGWKQCDIILIPGDAYIDSPFSSGFAS